MVSRLPATLLTTLMMLFLDGRCNGLPCNDVGRWVGSYEEAFEWLTQLTACGWCLESAIITDQNDSISLPIEAFDGQPIKVHIKRLQNEISQILSDRPQSFTLPMHTNLKQWFLQLDDYYAKLLNQLEKLIFLTEIGLRKTATMRNESMRTFLLNAYATRLHHHRQMHQQVKVSYQKNQQLLQKNL